MEISTRTTNIIVLATLLLAGVVQSAVLHEKADRWRDQDESWVEELNLVEPPPNPRLLLNHFDQPQDKLAPALGLKTLIKALYQLNAFDDRAAMEDQNVEEHESQNIVEHSKLEEPESRNAPKSQLNFEDNSPFNTEETTVTIELSPQSESSSSSDSNSSSNVEETTVSLLSVELSPPKEATGDSSEETTPRNLAILLEDLVDTAHLPTHGESDRTDKFTHSFRYGYGTPFLFRM